MAQGAKPGLSLTKGDAWKALLSTRYLDSQQEIDETHVERLELSVLEPSPLKIQVSRKLAQTVVNGDVVPALAGAKPDVYTETVSLQNELVESTRAVLDPAQVRVGRLIRIVLPPGPLDGRWTVNLPGKPDAGVPDAIARYAVTGSAEHEGRMFTRIRIHYEERGDQAIAADGTGEIDNVTGLVSELKLRASNVQIPGGTDRTGAEISFTVTQLPKR
jgi:hypothetical protein